LNNISPAIVLSEGCFVARGEELTLLCERCSALNKIKSQALNAYVSRTAVLRAKNRRSAFRHPTDIAAGMGVDKFCTHTLNLAICSKRGLGEQRGRVEQHMPVLDL